MSRENVEVVRSMFEAAERQDWDGFRQFLEDVDAAWEEALEAVDLSE